MVNASKDFASAGESVARNTVWIAAILSPFKSGWAFSGMAIRLNHPDDKVPKPVESGMGIVGYVVCEVDADQLDAVKVLNNPDKPVEIISQNLRRVIYAQSEQDYAYEIVPAAAGPICEGMSIQHGYKIPLLAGDQLADRFGNITQTVGPQPCLALAKPRQERR